MVIPAVVFGSVVGIWLLAFTVRGVLYSGKIPWNWIHTRSILSRRLADFEQHPLLSWTTAECSGLVETEESSLTLRGVTDVFFQLTAQASDRVVPGQQHHHVLSV